MARQDAILLEHVCLRPPAPAGFAFADASVSAGGEGLFLFIADDPAGDVHGRDTKGGASFARSRMFAPKRFHLMAIGANGTMAIDTPPLDLAHPSAALFPDGRVLLAGARCQWRGPGDHDLNGAILDPKHGSVKRLLLGDGIADMGVDALGRIWVSYFDEGVFGNYGWNHPGPRGPGRGGLVCFDDDGRILWQFNTENEAPIADCYALNATPDAMWAHYYTDFEICRVGMDFSKTFWPPPGASGAHAFAVCDNAFLFGPGYRDQKDRVHLVRREGGQLGKAKTLRVVAPDGEPLNGSHITGRGKYLHFLNSRGWFRADAETIAGH